jgi:hypothetical protein
MEEPRGSRYDAPRFKTPEEDPRMRMPRLRAALVALCAVAGVAATPSALADGGSISFKVIKAGFVIGGSAGSGTLNFHGRSYHVAIGGLSYGFTFGGSVINFHGSVSNISRPSDVAGVYGAGGVGAAAGNAGAGAIVLTNQKGAVLELSGQQVGLMANADLSGLAISLR